MLFREIEESPKWTFMKSSSSNFYCPIDHAKYIFGVQLELRLLVFVLHHSALTMPVLHFALRIVTGLTGRNISNYRKVFEKE